MDITPLIPKGKKIITAYGAGSIFINGTRHQGHLMVTPDLLSEWVVSDPNQLAVGDFASLPKTETLVILLIGCGSTHKMLSVKLKNHLYNLGYLAEPMQSAAACRTYNILLSEDRNVVAALINTLN